MDYKLARSLKDAGLPQKTHGEYICEDRVYRYGAIDEKDILDVAYCPTLSELIDACGDGFLDLSKTLDNGWYSRSVKDNEPVKEVRGRTPEEAVANLYIALHE